MDKVKPTGEILAGVMLLEYLGWRDAGARLRDAVKSVVGSKTLTYDLARHMPGAKEVRTSAFAQDVVEAVYGVSRWTPAAATRAYRGCIPPDAARWGGTD